MHDYRKLAKLAASAASDIKAKDILVFDLRQNSDMTDYVVIAGAESSPQLRALQDHIEDTLAVAGAKPLHRDGRPRGRWTALDYGSLVVHLMLPEARDLYRLEHLWESPKRVAWESAEEPEPKPRPKSKPVPVRKAPAKKAKAPAKKKPVTKKSVTKKAKRK